MLDAGYWMLDKEIWNQKDGKHPRPPRLSESDPPAMQGTSGQVAGRQHRASRIYFQQRKEKQA